MNAELEAAEARAATERAVWYFAVLRALYRKGSLQESITGEDLRRELLSGTGHTKVTP